MSDPWIEEVLRNAEAATERRQRARGTAGLEADLRTVRPEKPPRVRHHWVRTRLLEVDPRGDLLAVATIYAWGALFTLSVFVGVLLAMALR